MSNWTIVKVGDAIVTGQTAFLEQHVEVHVDLFDWNQGGFHAVTYKFPRDYVVAMNASQLPLDASRAV